MEKKWTAEPADGGQRFREFLKKKLPSETVRSIRWLLDHHRCRLNGSIERFGSKRLETGDKVMVNLAAPPPGALLYEDPGFFVYNKPPGISSENLSKQLDAILVHRLDRDTSGLMIFAKRTEDQAFFEALFRKRRIKKEYLAVVWGEPAQEAGAILAPLAPFKKGLDNVIWAISRSGLHAETRWKCLQKEKGKALLLCFPITGRTHQIRIHLQAIGHPIVGDIIYGGGRRQPALRPLLHSHKLSFPHPRYASPLFFQAPPPPDFPDCFNLKNSLYSCPC